MGAYSIVNHINSWNVQTVSDVKTQTCLLDSCAFFVHIKIIKCKIMNSYMSLLNTLSYFHLKYLLLSFHTYQGDVYPAQSHFWVNTKSSTFWGRVPAQRTLPPGPAAGHHDCWVDSTALQPSDFLSAFWLAEAPQAVSCSHTKTHY